MPRHCNQIGCEIRPSFNYQGQTNVSLLCFPLSRTRCHIHKRMGIGTWAWAPQKHRYPAEEQALGMPQTCSGHLEQKS